MPALLPDEDTDISKEISKVVSDYGRWLETPSDLFGGAKPAALKGTPDETLLRDFVRRAKHGITS